ncbi:glycerol-3-phosphate ABC transporter permease [Flexivirga endophytica]|uniref:Glycerol-3-phosphate ABC transporter permease n=1 Tax=Flexivirga endophytica TaxID=1849103 RepID=A0A916WPD3_9MICO|nr:sugar ABC transporter permease [Flexivirga endophytica]GGB17771.1 glycerol-3-phosphate ABC transporter permease [Flexivirga endophytica]GHB37844.1 glycerol-3-phosphate ABC transporter permease [Flexivirga endophytica]
MTTAPGEQVTTTGAGHRGWVGVAFVSPAALLFVVFILGPFVAAIILSFYSWDMLTPSKFNGIGNFTQMFSDATLYKALANTFIFSIASVITHLIGGFLLALGVNRLASRALSYFVRTSLFFPFVISWAAVALLWKYVLDPTFGIVTYYLGEIGITSPDWFTDPHWALPAIIAIDWWHTIGFTFIIMLAGLQTVPGELIEAARSDGCNGWQVLWNVTIPLMSPTIFFAGVITFIGAFQIFDPVQIITPNGGPDNATLTIVMYLYQKGFQSFQVGYASAVSLLVFAIMAAVTALQFWASKKWVHSV